MHGRGGLSASVGHSSRHSPAGFPAPLQAVNPPSSSGAVAQYSMLMQPRLLDCPKRISLTLCRAEAAGSQRDLCDTGNPTAPNH